MDQKNKINHQITLNLIKFWLNSIWVRGFIAWHLFGLKNANLIKFEGKFGLNLIKFSPNLLNFFAKWRFFAVLNI